MTEPLAILLVLIGTIIGAVGAVFVKLGSAKFKLSIKGSILNYKLIIGAFLYIISMIPFLFALKLGELSVIYPIVALGYIWVVLLSLVYLKERINKITLTGIIVIFIGVILVII